jgi:Glycosyl transferase family 2
MMKFRLPSADRAALPGELRVEEIGRFANYLFASGWVADCAGDPPARSYRFADSGQEIQAEYSYHFTHETDPTRTGFLDLFWVNDGYRLIVGPSQPVTAALADPRKPGLIRQTEIHRVEDGAFADLLRQLKAAKRREAWTNRIVFEILNHCNDDDRAGFFAVAIDRIGWHAMNEDVIARLAATGRDESHPDYLDFLCLCISGLDARYLPTELRERFVQLSAELRIGRSDRRLARDVVRQLARIEPDLACEFAHRMIHDLDYDREALADCMRHCFPQDSQWWIHHALLNEELGPEQAADALNCAGSTAAAEGRTALARLCYEAAMRIAPASQSPAWNAGWLRFETGDLAGAAECFKRITRHYTHQSLSTRWPHAGNLPWPLGKLDAASFTLPDGVTAWPRISVVTPSYNQGCYIGETILSVLNQGYPNLQYIIVDGNSTDSTHEVLERYRDRIDHLIIESDKGQTEAINKGLRLVDGEIVAWINSDDVYAPGALHVAALRWLETKADLIAGVCIEHVNRRMQLFNKPAADDSDFNAPQLARIFRYWLKGFYFYQPELFFSKRILDKAGLLDESLYYSMDYDLWMRFAKAGGSLSVVDWPFAFFRKHENQKTANLVDCIEEQARVRSRHHRLEPGEERAHRIKRLLATLGRTEKPLVGVLTRRMSKIFSPAVQAELDRFGKAGFEFHLSDDEKDPRIAQADLVILLAHVLEDPKTVAWLREARPGRPIVAWFWDNHHHLFENHETADAVDVIFPGHAIYGEYLRGDQSLYGGHVPLCVTQWARQDIAEWFKEHGGGNRCPDLYGGFVEYVFEPARTGFLHKVMEMLPKHALTILSETNLKSYFGRAEKDRFTEWCRYQTSLILPLRNDLSQRVFDALLAGLIPLVPEEIKDLDDVVPRDLQESLPIVRFHMKDPASAVEAQRVAVQRFAEGGQDAARARHQYALENHMFASRINRILDQLTGFSSDDNHSEP